MRSGIRLLIQRYCAMYIQDGGRVHQDRRVRATCKVQGWTQAELASRSGLSVATVARFEATGQGQVSSLIHLCAAFGQLEGFSALLPPAAPSSMDELRRQQGRRGPR